MSSHNIVSNEWLNNKIAQHYGEKNLSKFANDERHSFTYSMISKHVGNHQKITDRYKNHYYLFFLALENGLI